MGIGMAIGALREKLIKDINESGLPPVVVELVLQPLMAELHGMAIGQIQAEQIQAEQIHKKEEKEKADAGTEHADDGE